MSKTFGRKPVRTFTIAALCASITAGAYAMGGKPSTRDTASIGGYTQTKYPIVLTHGLFGFDSIGTVEYFYGIPSALKRDGAVVYTTKVSAANTSEVRGDQLLFELRRLQATFGHQKFHLIGHSHGGQSVRYVAAVAPELVASVLTVGSPAQGTAVADAVQRVVDGTGTTSVVASVFNVLSRVIDALGGGVRLPQSSDGAMRSLTTAGAKDFNSRFPQGAPDGPCGSGAPIVNGVRYYSVSGTGRVTNLFDPDSVLGITSLFFGGRDNDGLVERCSSRWGEVLRDDYPWNHADQINQTFGMRGWGTPDPVAFYRSHANRLKLAGL
jgi:triacylglycerol lipase